MQRSNGGLARAAAVALTVLAGCSSSNGKTSIREAGAISGSVWGATGVTVQLTGAASASLTTDGPFKFRSLVNGSYVITASKDGYTFDPPRIEVTVNGADMRSRDFGACSPDHWCWRNGVARGSDLWAVWASGPSDVWAVGDGGTILHDDDAAWAHVESGTTANLRAVSGTGPADVWAVGEAGTILHETGSGWSSVASGTDQLLYAVWAGDRSDAWAVG
jgi:hypothetical protein